MKKIAFPLDSNSHGLEVVNLQDALRFLVDQRFYEGDPAELAQFVERIQGERANRGYGDFTGRLVVMFQTQTQERFGLIESGIVDAETARAITQVLQEIGALPMPPVSEQMRLVAGVVRRADQQPFPGSVVSAFHKDERGPLRLGQDTTDTDGQYTIRYSMISGIDSINLFVTVSNADGERLGGSDTFAHAEPVAFVNVQLTQPEVKPPAVETPAVQRSMEGRVVYENGLPAEGITLRLYQHVFNGEPAPVSETVTQPFGLYALAFSSTGSAAGLEVRAVNAAGGEEPLTKTLNDLGEGDRALVNLVAPLSLQPQPAEFDRLAADLAPHVGDVSGLASVVEDDKRQDLTLLNRAAGWDARLIAMASKAAVLSADPRVDLPQPVAYALFRMGLPTERLQLAQVSPEVLSLALDSAVKSGIVALAPAQLDAVKTKLETFTGQTRLSMPAPGSMATYSDLLQATSVAPDMQDRFATVFLSHRGDPGQLWKKAAAAGVPEDDILALQRQGKLAYLTANNLALTTHLLQTMQVSDPLQLVDKDLYEAETWFAEINRAAGLPADVNPAALNAEQAKQLKAAIPPAFLGDTLTEMRDAYANDMARKIRISYPTQVVARLVERDETDQFALGEARQPVITFMKSESGKAFRLGRTPVENYFKSLPQELPDLTAAQIQTTKQSLKTLQRVYQMTPSNEDIPVLMKMGLTSAHDITAMSREAFVERFGKVSNAPEKAKLIYRKAEQVSTVTYNLFTIARKSESQGPVSVISAPAEARQVVRDKLVKEFPTLESLFGSLDFCDCEHCRSVLSPAAYLVDLLQFLDQNADAAQEGNWAHKMEKWQTEHHNAVYPFRNLKDQSRYLESWRRQHPGEPDPDTRRTPYAVLRARRPDLPHIPLTCENTNTTLPYIDIVNEILEYYVANQALTPEAARDTGSATSDELLAEPQNVITKAYNKLLDERYPLNLPFDLPLETVRRFSDYFEIPLWRMLEPFRPTDELFAPQAHYDRFAILAESLGLSPAETAIFTAADPLADWFKLYGFASAAEALTEAEDADTHQRIDLNSAKALSRRLGLTYNQLVDILRTGFVNPGLGPLAVLNKLEVTLEQVVTYQKDRPLIALDQSTLSQIERQRSTEAAAFEKKLAELSEQYQQAGFDAKAWIDTALLNHDFDNVLVLADTSASCDFDQTLLRYADQRPEAEPPTDGRPVDDFALLKINLFVRLWRKLGWSIEEVDATLTAFIPANAPFEPANLGQSPLRSALVYLAHLKELDERLRPGPDGRLKLVTLWANIPNKGKDSLYAQLFLNHRMSLLDPIFDDPLGEYLVPDNLTAAAEKHVFTASLTNVAPGDEIDTAPLAGDPRLTLEYDPILRVQRLTYQGVLADEQKAALLGLSAHPALPALLDEVQALGKSYTRLEGHQPALQSALELSAAEIKQILEQDRLTFEEAELSLENVSLLCRHALLARWMKLPVGGLISLKQLTGLNPFQTLSADPLADLAQDTPYTQTLAFLDAAELVADSGFKVEDLDYLLCHRFDPHGKYRPDPDARLALLRSTAAGVWALRLEHALPPEPENISEELLRQKLGLALAPEAVERFLAMLNGTVEFTAVEGGVGEPAALKPETFAAEPSIRKVSYNQTRSEQSLTLRGVLVEAEVNRLKGLFPSPVFGKLLDQIQAMARQFYESHLQKQTLRRPEEAGFLDQDDFEPLFTQLLPIPANATPDEMAGVLKLNEECLHRLRRQVAAAFLPFLQRRLERQLVVQSLTALTGVEPLLIEALLTDTRLLGDADPLVESFTGVGVRGLTAQFFTDAEMAEPLPESPVFAEADTGLKDAAGKRLRPAAAHSARFSGWLEVPAPGAYRFYVTLEKAGSEASLSFAHLARPLVQGPALADHTELGRQPGEFLELKPGQLYQFTLNLKNLDGGEARLLVQGETLPKAGLAQLVLLPQAEVERFERAGVMLAKAVQLIQSFGLNEAETRFLFNREGSFHGLDLGDLPNLAPAAPAHTPAGTPDRFAGWMRLARYNRLRRELAGGTDGLLAVLAAETAEDAAPILARLIRKDEATVKQTMTFALLSVPMIGGAPAEGEGSLPRLWRALQIVHRFGASPSAVATWARVVDRGLNPEQRFAIARNLRETLKARFKPDAWQRVARAVFDPLRQRQRDALAAYVMHRHGFARLEQLYEYFLVDPGMEPVVLTSRIRLAISSVQLFIQRCLLNLEREVHPAMIPAKQWEWMKRYRVWEAFRRMWLFPENWLEPEFRDDKTHLFREMESHLLQGDVSNDLVEDAFLNYLKKLEELARLNIVGLYVEQKDNAAQNTLHVIGRTYSTPYKYFYRTYSKQMWTPWEPVTAEIQGDHIAPVVWRDRLYLFWVTFMDKSDPDSQVNDPNSIIAQAVTQVTANNFGKKADMLEGGVDQIAGIADLKAGSVEVALKGQVGATNSGKKDGKKEPPTTLAAMSVAQVASGVRDGLTSKLVEVHLHWSEYFQGAWSTRESGEYATPIFARVGLNFDPQSVFVHVSKEPDQDDESRGVFIHLGKPVDAAFYLAGRNAQPRRASVGTPPRIPYTIHKISANRYISNGPLKVSFTRRITRENGGAPMSVPENDSILSKGGEFSLLTAANVLPLSDPEIASLIVPFFYQSDEHTFFVEPNLIEKTIQDWQEWLPPPPARDPGQDQDLPSKWKGLVKPFAAKPKNIIPLDPRDPLFQLPIHPEAQFSVQPNQDWLVNPATVLQFDGELIGPAGRAGIAVVPGAEAGAVAEAGALLVRAGAGSQLAFDTALAAKPSSALEASGLVDAPGGLNVVGNAGLNSALVKNLSAFSR